MKEKTLKQMLDLDSLIYKEKEFWQVKEKLIGQIVEIRADSISKSQDGSYWSLRFPRFKSFRGFEKKKSCSFNFIVLKFQNNEIL